MRAPLAYFFSREDKGKNFQQTVYMAVCLNDWLIDWPSGLPMTSYSLQLSDGRSFNVKVRFDTDVELTYFKHGGILNYMIRSMLH